MHLVGIYMLEYYYDARTHEREKYFKLFSEFNICS